MRAVVASMLAGALAAPCGAAAAKEAPYDALLKPTRAVEIVLTGVCLPYILDGKPADQLARDERLVAMPPKSVGAKAGDRVWRLGSIQHVNAVAWADGSCSTYADRGDPEKYRAIAEAALLARPERFAKGRTEILEGKANRTVYCAARGDEVFVATVVTGLPGAKQRALSSTVFRSRTPGGPPLCHPN